MGAILGIAILTGFGLAPHALADSLTNAVVTYQQQRHPNPDGIGKVYLGREIAKTMGHQGAGWLERPSRSFEEQPMQLIAALDLQPTDVVADIGAGTGYFSIRMSPLVPNGKVLAVDIQPEMLGFLEFHTQERGISNIEPILGNLTDPQLPPDSIDLALMVDAYHEFAYPQEMMTGIVRSLKPGGRVALVEYRGENPFIPIKPLHKMTQRQAKREMGAVGLRWLETKNMLPQQHVMIFQKPVSTVQEGQKSLAP
jgi:ubiquinone/menaquinone biosynthesis C-methylase UbiE